MKQIYGNIMQIPFKIPDDELGFGYTFSNPDKSGWLQKQGVCAGGGGWACTPFLFVLLALALFSALTLWRLRVSCRY